MNTYVTSSRMTIIHANKRFLLKSLSAIELTFVCFVRERVFFDFPIFIFNARASFDAVVVTGAVGKTFFMLSETFVHLVVVAIRIRDAFVQNHVTVIFANIRQIERIAGFVENGACRPSLFLLEKLCSIYLGNSRAQTIPKKTKRCRNILSKEE